MYTSSGDYLIFLPGSLKLQAYPEEKEALGKTLTNARWEK